MADVSVLNFGDGGGNRNIKDTTSRTNSSNALTMLAYKEDGNTASQAYAVIGTPINWKGTLYYTKTAVAAGTTWAVGTNLTSAPNMGKLARNINVYVGGDSKIHFTDLTGADTVLPFSGSSAITGWTEVHRNTQGQYFNVTKDCYYIAFCSMDTSSSFIRCTKLGWSDYSMMLFRANSSGQETSSNAFYVVLKLNFEE